MLVIRAIKAVAVKAAANEMTSSIAKVISVHARDVTSAETADMTAAGREAFAGWCAVIARALLRDGFGKAEARRLSTLTVSAIEGALILARVEGSAQPIEDVAKSLAAALQIKVPARKRVVA